MEFDESASGTVVITAGPSSGLTTVSAGGLSVTIAADDGSNNTNNVVLAEIPFDVNIFAPANTFYKVRYTSNSVTTTTELRTGTYILDEAQVSRGDLVEIAAVRLGFAMVYQTFTVNQLGVDGIQNENITITSAEPYPTGVDSSGVTRNSFTWDSTNHWLIADFADIPQNNLVMNKMMTESLMDNNTRQAHTIDAILHFKDAGFYRSGGIATGHFVDPLKVKVTSSTASGNNSKETYPFYDILGTSTDIYDLTDQDTPLGQNTLRPMLTADDLLAALQPEFEQLL